MPKKGNSDPVKEKFWRKQISDFEASGMTLTEFCRSRGLSLKNFSNWRKRLSVRDAARKHAEPEVSITDFAPLHVVEQISTEPGARSDSTISMEIVLRNGTVLRLAEGCSMKLMSSVFSLVGVK